MFLSVTVSAFRSTYFGKNDLWLKPCQLTTAIRLTKLFFTSTLLSTRPRPRCGTNSIFLMFCTSTIHRWRRMKWGSRCHVTWDTLLYSPHAPREAMIPAALEWVHWHFILHVDRNFFFKPRAQVICSCELLCRGVWHRPRRQDLPPIPSITSENTTLQVYTHRSVFARPTHVFEDAPGDPACCVLF